MIVNDMCEMISRDTVALQEDEVHIIPRHFEFAAYSVHNGDILIRFSTAETEHPFLAGVDILFYLLYGKITALGVFAVDTRVFLIGSLLFADLVDLFSSHEAGISEPAFNEMLGENMIDIFSLTLAVRTVSTVIAVRNGAFVEMDAEIIHGIYDSIYSAFYFALAVSVFDPEVENTA